MNKIHLLLVFIALLVNIAKAQDGKSGIVTYEPFKADSSNGTNGTSGSNAIQYNYTTCVKWNYSLLSRGVFLLNIEKSINKNLGLEAGFGLTYKDFIFESLVYDNGLSFDYENIKSGFALEGGIKYYPRGAIDMDGAYLQHTLSYRIYNQSIDQMNSYNIENTDFGYKMFDLQFKFGYQYEGYYWDVLNDFYFGIGYRNATYFEIESDYSTDPTTHVRTKKQAKLPQILFGFKIGFPY